MPELYGWTRALPGTYTSTRSFRQAQEGATMPLAREADDAASALSAIDDADAMMPIIATRGGRVITSTPHMRAKSALMPACAGRTRQRAD